jgi:hypothetical protein
LGRLVWVAWLGGLVWVAHRGGAVAGRDSLRIAGRGVEGDGCAPDMLAAFFFILPFVTLGAA